MQNMIVCVKQVMISTEYIKLDSTGVISEKGMTFDISEWDEYALEEAVQIKERLGGSVTAITYGPERSEKVLKACLSKGADRAIRIWEPGLNVSDSAVLARVLSEEIKKLDYSLLFFGVQAADDGNAQLGSMVAHILDLPYSTMITKVEFNGNKVRVHRELEDRFEELLMLDLPAALTIQTGINRPRYPPVKAILKAMKETIPVWNLEQINPGMSATLKPKVKVDKLYTPQRERSAVILGGRTDEAVDKLLNILTEKGLI